MEISACPVCESDDIRVEYSAVSSHTVLSWRAGEERPVFVARERPIDTEISQRVVCINGHAHPDQVGFDLEWD